jgi:ligand-binding sensor domain-containing protein
MVNWAVITREWRARRRLRFVVVTLLAAGLAAGTAFVWRTRQAARQTVDEARLEGGFAGRVDVVSTTVAPPNMDGVTLWLYGGEARALTEFRGKLWAATSGGLARYAANGTLERRYTTGDGLPENDLTALATFQNRLFVGSRTAGLLSFDGETFTRHVFQSPKATMITALLATPTRLLIGAQGAGLIDYDGTSFAQRFQPPKGPKIESATALLAVGPRLYVGTQSQGLFVWRDGELHQLSTREALASPRVTALAMSDGAVYVATDAAVGRLAGDETLELISSRPNVTSLVEFGGTLWAGVVTGGAVEIPRAGRPAAKGERFDRFATTTEPSAEKRPAQTTVAVVQNALWALTEKGVYALTVRAGRPPEWRAWGDGAAESNLLTAAHVTSLAFDVQGRLWVGTFERGVDILSPERGEREAHLQDEAVREINFLAAARENGRMFVATSAGLVAYDRNLRATRYSEKSAAIVGDAVSHVLRLPGVAVSGGRFEPAPEAGADPPLALATAKGLTVMQSGVSRSLTAFHGLASNYLYCCERLGDRLYVGSLGGLMEFNGLRVARTWKIDNSRLPSNWINALTAVNGTLYVGTYGGGVCALLPSGEIERFEPTKGLEVNANAMATDGERLYVGTLDRGLAIYDFTRRTWKEWRAGLASQNVTSVALRGEDVFVGTTGGVVRIERRRLAE